MEQRVSIISQHTRTGKITAVLYYNRNRQQRNEVWCGLIAGRGGTAEEKRGKKESQEGDEKFFIA